MSRAFGVGGEPAPGAWHQLGNVDGRIDVCDVDLYWLNTAEGLMGLGQTAPELISICLASEKTL